MKVIIIYIIIYFIFYIILYIIIGVYRCKLCDCVCKDSLTWLDHLNGKKHNQMLGMSMKVERVGVDRVKEKFASLKKKVNKPIDNFEDFEAKFAEEEKIKKEKKKKKKSKPQQQ